MALINRISYFDQKVASNLNPTDLRINNPNFQDSDILHVEVMTGDVVVDEITLPIIGNVDIEGRSLNINYFDIIGEQMGLVSGEYTIRTSLLRNPIFPNDEVRVDDISRNKTEIRLDGWADDDAIRAIPLADPNSMKTLRLVHEKLGIIRVINWSVDTHFKEAAIIVKSIDTFPKALRKGDKVALYDDIIDPFTIKISIQLEVFEPVEAFKDLKGPNWNIQLNKTVGAPTELSSWDDILSSNQATKNSLVNEIFSGSSAAELNVDYSDFKNFIHFSSAEERLENFKYKLGLIEAYTTQKVNALEEITGSIQYVSQSLNLDQKITGVKGTFDGYEKYLYYTSGSTFTDTYGIHPVADWPKQYSSKPYMPLATTHADSIAWFNTRKIAAQDYDQQNDSSLRNTIPLHIKLNSENNGYVMFVDMVAQHFDDVYLYVDQLKNIHDKTEGVNNGLSKDMLFDVLGSFGWKPQAGFGVTDLWEYYLGTNVDGGDSNRDRIVNGAITSPATEWTTTGAGSVTGGYGQVGGAGAYSQVAQANVLEIGKRYKVTVDIVGHEGVDDPIGVNNGNGSSGGWGASFPTAGAGTTVSLITPVVQVTTSLQIFKASTTNARWTKFDNVTCREVTAAELEMYPGGAELNTVGNETLPIKDLEMEPWKRILNNLPFLLKTKGTKRGIKALMSCYGIPSTILKIQEFGGSDPDITGVNNLKEINQPSYAVSFEGDGYLKQGSIPAGVNTVEVRFRHKPNPSGTAMNLVTAADQSTAAAQWCIYLSNATTLEFKVLNGSTWESVSVTGLPLFDNDWWSVFVTLDTTTHDYTLRCQKSPDHADGKITHTKNAVLNLSGVPSGWSNSNSVVLGGAFTVDSVSLPKFTGQMQEFRLWDNELSSTVLDIHTKAPISILGNSYTGSFDNLMYRLPMGADTVKTSLVPGTNRMDSLHPDQTTTFKADVYGALTWSYVEEDYFTPVPNSIGLRGVDSKIRIEVNDNVGDLHPFESREKSSHDRNPIDSNLLFVGFSPQDELDTDIALQFGGLTVDDIVGDPRDKFKSEYQGLKQFRDAYFKKYNGKQNLWAYMRIIQFFNTALFKQIESMLPARANKIVGLIIKPSLLERPKMVTEPKVSYLDLHLRGKIDYDMPARINADDRDATYIQLVDGSGTNRHKQWASYIPASIDCQEIIKGDKDGVQARAHDTRIIGRRDADGSYSAGLFTDQLGNVIGMQPQDDFTGFRNLVRDGCKMMSLDWNVDSADTIDGKAVVQVFETNPNKLISDDLTYDGQIKVV